MKTTSSSKTPNDFTKSPERTKKFINQLVQERKITLVEPSIHIQQSYNKKSENALKAAKILSRNNLFEESTSMTYYAMFHKTNSLFRYVGIKCENHTAILILLQEIFNIENSTISFAKQERIEKQYYTDSSANKKASKELMNKAEEFLAELDIFIENITEIHQKEFREKMKNLALKEGVFSVQGL